MNVYAFSSKNLTNIWAGIGSGKWAISEKQAGLPVVRASAKRFPVGSLGLFYCTEIKAFSTPFVTITAPDPTAVVTDIWPEPWRYPFSIRTFGNPTKILKSSRALKLLPILQKAGTSGWTKVLRFQPTFAFQASALPDADWDLIVRELTV